MTSYPIDDPSTPGPMTVIHNVIDQVLAAAARYKDPIDRAQSLDGAHEVIPLLQQAVRRARAQAIREALTTRTAVDVASELGISRSRLYKVLEE